MSKKKKASLFIILTLSLTWILQFMPMLLHMDVSDTSISSFDKASIFFFFGGMMPSLLGVIFVFRTYSKEQKLDYFKRCLLPTKRSWLCILGALLFISLEVFITQMCVRIFADAVPLGFEGLKMIGATPYMFFYFLFWGLVSGPCSEEFGWRGFLADCICQPEHMFRSTLVIGLVWGFWHLPLYFYPAQVQYEWLKTSPLLAVGFLVSCVTNALVYNIFYVISKRRVFTIFFLHMFENIVLTGAMIYPFSKAYEIAVVPVSIVVDILFYIIMSRTKLYQNALKELGR